MKPENNNAGTNPDIHLNDGRLSDVHLSNDALVDAYYGACDDPAAVRAHISSCGSCAERWNELLRRRSAAARPIEVSAEFLAEQRRKIYDRIERPAPGRWRVWVPTAATAALLTAAIFTFRPAPETARPERPEVEIAQGPEIAPRPEFNDAQLFSDVYSLEQTYEPSAAAPIQALFVDEQK